MIPIANPKKNTHDVVFWMALSAILALCMGRDWTWDEATSYDNVLATTVWELFRYQKFNLANHHLINSLYFKVLQSVGIQHVFFFRLLSVIGFVLFYFSNVQLLRIWNISRIHILFLIVAPYFTYFSQARGYALSIGLISLSLCSLVKFIQSREVKYEYYMVCAACLSALSILSFFFASAAIFTIYAFLKYRQRLNIHFVFHTIIFLATGIYIYYTAKIVQANDPNIIGSDFLLKNGMMSSIISDFTFQQELERFQYYHVLKMAMLLMIAVPFIFLSRLLWDGLLGRGYAGYDHRSMILLVMIVSISGICLKHLIFGGMYPLGRAVLYMHYLLILNAIVVMRHYFPLQHTYSFPLFFMMMVSGYHAYILVSDMARPGIATHLKTPGQMPLYLLNYGDNPNLEHVNALEGIHKKNVYKAKTVQELNQMLKADSAQPSYILSPVSHMDSIIHLGNTLYQGRDNFYLLKEKSY